MVLVLLLPSTRASARNRCRVNRSTNSGTNAATFAPCSDSHDSAMKRWIVSSPNMPAKSVRRRSALARMVRGRISTGAALRGSTMLMDGFSLLDGMDGRAERGSRCGRSLHAGRRRTRQTWRTRRGRDQEPVKGGRVIGKGSEHLVGDIAHRDHEVGVLDQASMERVRAARR